MQLGFKKSLILITSSLLILALFITGIFSYGLLKQNATEDLINRVETAMDFEAKVIQSYISKHSEPARALAELYQKNNYQTGHEKIAAVVAKASSVRKITIGFDDGSSFVSKPSNSTFPGGIGIKEKYDPRTRAWYQKGKVNSDLTLSDIFFTKQGIPMFGATHPIAGGIVMADISLVQLQEVLEGVDILEGSVGVIADQKGMILASTAEYAETRKTLEEIPEYASYARTILNSANTFNETNIQGNNSLLFSKRVDLIGDTKMVLVIAIDSKTAFAPVARQTSTLVTSMLFILAVSAVIVVFSLNYLYKPVIELRNLIQNLSSGEGDLTQRLQVNSQDDLGQIAQGVNSFIQGLQQSMLSIKSLSGGLSSGVSALQQQTDKSSRILSEHATQTDSVVSSMHELSASAGQVANSALEAAEFVAQANSKGESSRTTIQGAQNSINSLVSDVDTAAQNVETMSQETKDISSVLSIIGGIAEQTNLLALNAAIEAARAGEQGRGFAVVADEVRALAARTQESTGEIEGSLSKLRNGADSVVSAINQTKDTSQNTATDVHQISDGMEELIKQVNQVNQVSTEISQAANEQNSVIHHISESMTQIHTMVEELNQSGANISQETDAIANVNQELTSIVSKFKLES